MTEETFRAKRRQKFLTEKYFELNKKWAACLIQENVKIDESGITPMDPAYPDVFGSTFKNKNNFLKLHYTAGESIESLKPLYADAVMWMGKWTDAYRLYIRSLDGTGDDLRTDGTPLYFEDLFHFQLALDVVSLGVLLGDGAALRQMASWVERYRGADILFEHLIAPAVTNQRDNTDFFHVKPYDPLIDAFYTAETPQDASAFVKKYLDGWYKSFEGVPWHNGHLVAKEHQMPYEGYWAFEAAAVCVIHGIHDSSFRDHLLYPKDLADWARANGSLDKIKPSASGINSTPEQGRCEGGQPCPQTGFWFTPAKTHSRRYFKAGEVMPQLGGDYGSTIWQWDINQEPPKI